MDRIVIDARLDEYGRLVVTPKMLRMARKAVRMGVQDLSVRSGVAVATIYQHESAPPSKRLMPLTTLHLVQALNDFGVEFRTCDPGTNGAPFNVAGADGVLRYEQA